MSADLKQRIKDLEKSLQDKDKEIEKLNTFLALSMARVKTLSQELESVQQTIIPEEIEEDDDSQESFMTPEELSVNNTGTITL